MPYGDIWAAEVQPRIAFYTSRESCLVLWIIKNKLATVFLTSYLLLFISISSRCATSVPLVPHTVERSVPHQRWWMSVRSTDPVPQCEILTVVIVKEEMVIGVMCGSINVLFQQPGNLVIAIMDGYGPYINEHIEAQVQHLVQGEEEGVDVVG